MLPIKLQRVFLAEHRIDFRRGPDGFLAEAYRLGAQPYDGDAVIFVKKDRTQLRVIAGDRLGLYLIHRRFEGGTLRVLLGFSERPGARTVSSGEMALLLEGASFTIHKRAKPVRPSLKNSIDPRTSFVDRRS